MHRQAIAPCIALSIGLALGACSSHAPERLQVVGEAFAIRRGDPIPETSPWFDGARVAITAARGETVGLQVVGAGGPVTIALPGVRVRAFDVTDVRVRHGSTALYGGSRGDGEYPDALVPRDGATAATDPAYFELAVPSGTPAGPQWGVMLAGARAYPIELDVAPVALPPLAIGAWAEYSPAVLGGSMYAPSAGERACVAMFRERGVLLAPAMPLGALPARAGMLSDATYIPVDLPRAPDAAAADVRAWIAALAGTGRVPFAIPIDEPHGAAAQQRVRELADAVRAAGGGPGRFLFAVTDEPRAAYGDRVDLYITLAPKLADPFARWTYNGAPPRAGAMVVDGAPPGTRTWGWLAWRYRIPIWYAWEALYWEDRYNHRGLPPRPLDARGDARSFDDGEDHGNLDGVLALPDDDASGAGGCRPTLRLAALRRGLEDRALLDLVARCNRDATDALVAQLIPKALGDADPGAAAAWPTDEAAWETARRRLLELAACAP